MKKLGVVDSRGNQYRLEERLHLIKCLSKWSADLYIYGQLSWGKANRPISKVDRNMFLEIAKQCKEFGIELWVWMKPGDDRYCINKEDRKRFIENVVSYLELGADGFYLLMDDLHPRDPEDETEHIRRNDAESHAMLIEEIYREVGEMFKAICGEHYHGNIPGEYAYYWEPILGVLPKDVALTWTGPNIWNKHIAVDDVINTDHPLLFFENYFASDSEDPARSPIYPYAGRDPGLTDKFEIVVINSNNHYSWQFCALQTAMDFWRSPKNYNPDESFKQAVRDLGDMYVSELILR